MCQSKEIVVEAVLIIKGNIWLDTVSENVFLFPSGALAAYGEVYFKAWRAAKDVYLEVELKHLI